MPPWTCPNIKCRYDRELEAGQHCPLCMEEAKEFKFSELDNLWKQKWDFKKSVEGAKKHERVLGRRKFCPKCGSANINFLAFFRPSVWKCLDCGYEGVFIIEDKKIAEKIQEDYRNK